MSTLSATWILAASLSSRLVSAVVGPWRATPSTPAWQRPNTRKWSRKSHRLCLLSLANWRVTFTPWLECPRKFNKNWSMIISCSRRETVSCRYVSWLIWWSFGCCYPLVDTILIFGVISGCQCLPLLALWTWYLPQREQDLLSLVQWGRSSPFDFHATRWWPWSCKFAALCFLQKTSLFSWRVFTHLFSLHCIYVGVPSFG